MRPASWAAVRAASMTPSHGSVMLVANAPETAAGHRMHAGIDHGHAPVRPFAAVIIDAVGAEVDGNVAVVENKVYEIFLDHIALVAGADDEIIEAVMGIDIHDVPEDRHAADFDQRLRPYAGLLGKARSETTGENYNFHPKRTPESLEAIIVYGRRPARPPGMRGGTHRWNGRMVILVPVSDFVLVRGLRGCRPGTARARQAVETLPAVPARFLHCY